MSIRFGLCLFVATCLLSTTARADHHSTIVVYPGGDAAGAGKHVVLVAGDEEYRSEEALPQLGKILSVHHGFKCTVVFSVNPQTGEIDPDNQNNMPGLKELATADLMIIATRFRNPSDEQMKYVVDYVESAKPIIGLRTATHAFRIPKDRKYGRYSFNSQEWKQGFGRQVLGETWINHHGHHGREATRGIPAKGMEKHPILRGVKDIWGPTDVYGVRLPLPGDSQPLVLGLVTSGMTPADPVSFSRKNDPAMPVAWIKSYTAPNEKKARVFTTTMGASQDLENEGVRRMLVNATYWALGMEDKIPESSNVAIVGEFKATKFSFGGYVRGVKPSDHALK